MREGIFKNLSNEDYHNDDSIGSSKLKDLLVCPYNYKAIHIDKSVVKTSRSLNIGRLAHMRLLEPHLYAYEKATSKVADQINDMYKMINNHSRVKTFLEHGLKEHSFFCKDEDTGLRLKARPDCYFIGEPNESYPEGALQVIEYKTTSAAMDSRSLSYEARKWHFALQAAFYTKVIETCHKIPVAKYIFVLQSTKPPYLVRTFTIPDEAMLAANVQLGELLNTISNCMENNEWPSYSEQDEEFLYY